MSFDIGDKVVCIKTRINPCAQYSIYAGHIYTVRDIDRRAFELGVHNEPTVRLEEIVAPVDRGTIVGDWEPGHRMSNFAPLRKTDISIFTDMLKEKEVEPA